MEKWTPFRKRNSAQCQHRKRTPKRGPFFGPQNGARLLVKLWKLLLQRLRHASGLFKHEILCRPTFLIWLMVCCLPIYQPRANICNSRPNGTKNKKFLGKVAALKKGVHFKAKVWKKGHAFWSKSVDFYSIFGLLGKAAAWKKGKKFEVSEGDEQNCCLSSLRGAWNEQR